MTRAARAKDGASHERSLAWRPWLALLTLCVLFELPGMVQPDRVSLSGVRVPGDALLLAGVAIAMRGSRWQRAGHAALVLLAAVLLLYRIDAAVCVVLMRHAPVLYDQAFLLRHLAVLFADLLGGWAWLAALGALAIIALLVWLVRRLLDAVAARFAELPARTVRTAFAAMATTLLLASAFAGGAVRWVAPELAANLIAARKLTERIARGIERSPYLAYERLTLARRPNVYVFFVESYGRVMASDPSTSGAWRTALDAMQRELGAAGYHFASAFSEAPISGGRSWLAHASLFTGTHVDFQALYQSLFPNGRARVPHLPGFLQRQGYRTVLLAPADRARPGVSMENAYGYDETIRFQQLSYRGPFFGWGRIPDQYSLAYAQERVFTRRDRPLFFVFTMVSSHAPWSEVPELVADPHDPAAYRQLKQHALPAAVVPHSESHGTIVDQTRRYSRQNAKRSTAPASSALRQAYARSILYDLELLRRALLDLHGDDLILVLGDHQPPLVTSERDDFAAPIHVFARDPGVLAELLAHGFTPTLALDPHAKTALPHEALFSLLVRDLIRAGAPASSLPPFLPHGLRLAD